MEYSFQTTTGIQATDDNILQNTPLPHLKVTIGCTHTNRRLLMMLYLKAYNYNERYSYTKSNDTEIKVTHIHLLLLYYNCQYYIGIHIEGHSTC